jgi:S1-C subfamily serine protease
VAIQEVTKDLARSFGLREPKGALVSDVTKDGPAEKSGLKRGDVIVEFDGSPVNKMHELPLMVARRAPGKDVDVKILREGKPQTVRVKLGELPEEKPAAEEPVIGEDLGLAVQEITPELRRRLDLDVESGVIVAGVAPGSLGAQGASRSGTSSRRSTSGWSRISPPIGRPWPRARTRKARCSSSDGAPEPFTWSSPFRRRSSLHGGPERDAPARSPLAPPA